jgi:DNA polymerase delta subunit 1
MAEAYEPRDFFPYCWEIVESTDESHDKIRVWAFDTDSKPNLLVIDNYLPYFYIELSKSMLGSKKGNTQLWDQFPGILGTWLMNHSRCSVTPTKVELVKAFKLHYYSKNKSSFLKLMFNNISEAKTMSNFLKSNRYVSVGPISIGNMSFKVHEANFNDIDLINRLMAEPYCKFKYSGWCKFAVKPMEEKRKMSKITEWRVNCYRRLPFSDIKVSPNPVVLSYDIETYTPDYRKYMPKSTMVDCPVYLMTFYCGRVGSPRSEHRKQIVVLGEDTMNDEFIERGIEVVNLKNEKEIIKAYCDAINKFDPDIIIGYNICFYDNPYVEDRRQLFAAIWLNCSRLKNYAPEMKNHDYTGDRDNKTLLCPGRITVDVFSFVKKNKRLKQYKLSNVSKIYLKEDKRDVPYEEQFEAYKAWLKANERLNRLPNSKQGLKRISHSLYNEFVASIKDKEVDWIGGIHKLHEEAVRIIESQYEMKRSQLRACSEFLVALHLMYRVMDYGDQDSYLPWVLFQVLNIFPNIAAMAAVNYINPEDVYIRGESIRCLRMIYQTAKHIPTKREREELLAQGRHDDRPYIIDSRIPVKYHIAGGFVKDPIPGVHDKVATVDFKSLYPNEMITNNLCYTTLMPEGEAPKNVKYNTIKVPVPEHNIEYTHNWVDPSVRVGVIPLLEITLIAERNRIRKIQKEYKEGSLEWTLLEAQQLAVKIACNAAYGFLGVGCNLDKDKSKKGKNKNVEEYGAREYFSKLPLPEASMCITYCGRTHIQLIMDKLKEWYPDVIVVYGDTDSAMFHIPSITENLFKRYSEVGARLSAIMPGTLELEMENVSKILLFKKKHYIKLYYSDKEDRLNIDIHGPGYWNNGSERGIPKARRDRPNTVVEVHSTISDFILNGTDPITIYRWIIEYVLKLTTKSPSYFEIVKGYNSQAEGSNKNIVKRMAKLGVIINHMDRFGYIVCSVPGATKVGDMAYETDYFIKSQNTDNPLKINYHYYIKGLEGLDEMMTNVPELPERFHRIEYKRTNRCDPINFATNPFKMIASMVLGGEDIQCLLDLFDEMDEREKMGIDEDDWEEECE